MAVDSAARTKLAEMSGIGELKRAEQIIGLAPYLERASNRIRNYNSVRLTDMFGNDPAAATAYYASGSPAAIGAAIAARVMSTLVLTPDCNHA